MRPLGLALAAAALSGLFGCGSCARILVVLPFPARSHHMFATAIMGALAERGHSIVEYSVFAPKATISNHTHHFLETTFYRQLGSWTFNETISHGKQFQKIFGTNMHRVWEMNYDVCEETFMDEGIQNILRKKEKFDLVVVESTFGQESLLVLGHALSAPTVVMETFFPHSLTNWVSGNGLTAPPVPDLWGPVSDDKMTFVERMLTVISTVQTLYLYHNQHLPKQELIMKRAALAAGLGVVPSLEQLVANVSLYLTNSHPSAVHYPQPYTPNMLPIGGITIDPDKQHLTPDLKQFMDSATAGVIYFSFGSVVPTHSMPKETFDIFINVFKKLPQKILWKIDMDHVKLDLKMPPNVKTLKWAPQLAILGHRSCRLFITHGGLFSHQEALCSAVPTVYVPFFADQPYNARVAETRATGRTVVLQQLTERTLLEAVTAVLTDPRYKDNAKKMSFIYQDRPVLPKDSAVYWVEYVMRHRGAPHLRPASATMAWYKVLLLDVIALDAVAIFIITIILYRIIAYLWAKIFSKASVGVGKHKKHN